MCEPDISVLGKVALCSMLWLTAN